VEGRLVRSLTFVRAELLGETEACRIVLHQRLQPPNEAK
jgi:hypothetical protein